jgi:hypothetical protein
LVNVKSLVRLRAGESRDIWHVVREYDSDTGDGSTLCGVKFCYLDVIEGRDILPEEYTEYLYIFKLKRCRKCEEIES